MPDRDTARLLMAKDTSPARGRSDVRSGSHHLHAKTNLAERTWSESSTRDESAKREHDVPSPEIAVVWQWICFALGLVSMACGVWGICVQHGQNVLPGWGAWLGSFYVPVLRLVAVLCLGIGAVLVRRGWAQP